MSQDLMKSARRAHARDWRPALAAVAILGSIGLLGCEPAKQDTPLGAREAEPAPAMNEPAPPPPEPAPTAVGGGPTSTMTPSEMKSGPARGISALEQYLDGKDISVNRFALDGLTYENACPYLDQKGIDSVDALSDLLKKHPDAKVSIESFTDDTGSDEANKKLSRTRAEVVKDQLIMCGIESNRIEIVGRGSENPVASNDSEDGKAQNRRTEIIIRK